MGFEIGKKRLLTVQVPLLEGRDKARNVTLSNMLHFRQMAAMTLEKGLAIKNQVMAGCDLAFPTPTTMLVGIEG